MLNAFVAGNTAMGRAGLPELIGRRGRPAILLGDYQWN